MPVLHYYNTISFGSSLKFPGIPLYQAVVTLSRGKRVIQ